MPIGSCEQHGPYLPIDTDLKIAQLLATKLNSTFLKSETFLLDAIPFSCSWEHKGLGTIAINVSTLATIIHDIIYSLKSWLTPSLFVFINWHGGNGILSSLATEISATQNIPTIVIPQLDQIKQLTNKITTAKDVHAGAVETSIIQAFWPQLIQTSITNDFHDEPNIGEIKVQTVLQSLGSYAITKNGIWGAPEDANVTFGLKVIEILVENMHTQIVELLKIIQTINK